MKLQEFIDNPTLDKPTKSPQEIAMKHGVDVDEVIKRLQKGIDVEKEHTSDVRVAREIALDLVLPALLKADPNIPEEMQC